MWTTAGAIFSTTSAMKLNLYRGLLSLWRPALAGRTQCLSESQTLPKTCLGEGRKLAPETPLGSQPFGDTPRSAVQ